MATRSATPALPVQSPQAMERKESVHSKKAPDNRTMETITIDREKNLDWTSVESADYREYIANLRVIGCPEETVRDIIIADINKLYASKMASLYPSPKDIKFWKVEDRVARNEERDRDKKRNALEQEKRELIKELLGVDYESELARLSGRPSNDDLRYGFLAPEMQEKTKALRQKYREMERSLFADGGMTPENRGKFMALRAESETEMAKLLGPADFEQYQLRNSFTARNMRDNLSGFQPSEEEFKQIFQTRKAFDDQYAFNRDGGDSANAQERKAAQQKMDEQLKSVLGDARFRDYQLSQDGRYRDTFDFTQKYNLPRETTDTLYQVRVAAEQEKQRIQKDTSLTGDARTAALAGLSADTRAALGQTLGQEAMVNYVPRAGEWLNQLSPARGNSDGGGRRGGGGRGGNRGDRPGR
ncbi:MAG: hypothetical protein ABIQ35_09000 [Verrucomicrobiota bacterium]